jgi:hypothetical protein
VQERFQEQWIGYQMFPQTVLYRISVSVRATTRATTGPNESSSQSAAESKLWLEGGFEVPLRLRRDFRNLRKSSLKIRGRHRKEAAAIAMYKGRVTIRIDGEHPLLAKGRGELQWIMTPWSARRSGFEEKPSTDQKTLMQLMLREGMVLVGIGCVLGLLQAIGASPLFANSPLDVPPGLPHIFGIFRCSVAGVSLRLARLKARADKHLRRSLRWRLSTVCSEVTAIDSNERTTNPHSPADPRSGKQWATLAYRGECGI